MAQQNNKETTLKKSSSSVTNGQSRGRATEMLRARIQSLSSGEERSPQSDWISKDSMWSMWLQVKQDLMHDVEVTLHKQENYMLHVFKYGPGGKPVHVNNDKEKNSNMGITIPGEVSQQPPGWQDAKAWDKAALQPSNNLKSNHLTLPGSCSPRAKLTWATAMDASDVKDISAPSRTMPAPPTVPAPELGQIKRTSSTGNRRSCVDQLEDPLDKEDKTHPRKELSKMDYWLSSFEKWLANMKIKRKEPKRSGVLASIESGGAFSAVCLVVILMDAAYTAWSANRDAHNPGMNHTGGMKAIELCFTIVYVCELIIKLAVHKEYFFFNSNWNWNWFDFCVVIQSLIDTFMTYILDSDGGSATFMRILRLMRITKVLRVFRAIRFLQDLRAMIVAIVNCMSALFWAFITLGLVLYVFAIMMVNSMTAHIADNPSLSDSRRQDLKSFFGSLERTILTLYMCTTGGISWIEVYRVVEDVGALEIMAFIFFIGFFGFAVITILSGIFIEKALVATQPDRESMAMEMRRLDEQESQMLKELLFSMDNDGNGTLSFEEFSSALHDVHVQAYLRALGLAVNDAAMFFDLLAHEAGCENLPIAELCQRMCRMKGTATAMDLQTLMFEVSVIRKLILEVVKWTGANGTQKLLTEFANSRKHTMEFDALKQEAEYLEFARAPEIPGNNEVNDETASECLN